MNTFRIWRAVLAKLCLGDDASNRLVAEADGHWREIAEELLSLA